MQCSDLEGERRDGLPHVEGLSYGSLGILLSHFRGEVRYAAREEQGGKESVKTMTSSFKVHSAESIPAVSQ